jgi:hypothetical protein
MRLRAIGCFGLCFLFAFYGSAGAQTANDIANIFGGLVRSGARMAAQSAWEQIPPSELTCVDRALRQRGSSLNLAVDQAMGPTDYRISDILAACRVENTQQASGPSFDCSRAGFPDERLICSSGELSQLDNAVAAAFRFVRDRVGPPIAESIRGPSLQWRRACRADFECIKRAQLAAIDEYQRHGAPAPFKTPVTATRSLAHPEYVVDGLALGIRLKYTSANYQDYHCRPSDQFTGFTFCQMLREMREARGAYKSSNTILHSADGTAVYINRFLEPAFFDGNEAQADIDARTKRFGSSPRLIPMPSNSEVPNGMIATWGDVILEPLDPGVLKDVADGRSVRVGFMIDHIGDLRRSAKAGLPVYRLSGGAGYVWAASWNRRGVGTLQFLTVDASAFGAGPAPEPPAASSPDLTKTPSAKTEVEKAEESRLAAEKIASEKAAADKDAADRAEAERATAEKAAAQKAAAEKAAAEKLVAEKAAAEKAAAERAAAAQAAADRAAQQAEAERARQEAELARQNEIRQRGSDYAASSDTKWNITRRPNEMTDKIDILVRSIQKNDQGLMVEIEGACKNGEVRFSGLVVDEEGKANVKLVGRIAVGDGSIGYGVPALYRVNDKQPSNVIIPELEFINKLQLVVFAKPGGKSETVENNVRLMAALFGANVFANRSETWRIMAELKTDRGNFIVKIPVYDANIQALFQSCN